MLVIGYYYFSGRLVNPTRYMVLSSGTLALLFLVATLACTPLRRITGWPGAIQIRRALGLYSFAFAALHLLTYAALENAFSISLIWRDLGERRAMILGLLAFLLLIPLAVTSTQGWQRRLGRRWRKLHYLIYPAAILSVWHYLWLDRDIITAPLIYMAIVALLLAIRWPLRK